MGAAEALGGLQQNVLGSSIGIAEYVGIPQANDTPTVFGEIRRPPLIIRRAIDVLAPVELDGQPGAATRQIYDERCNDELPGKGRPVPRDPMPNREFGGRGIVAQLARSSRQFWIDATAHGAAYRGSLRSPTHPLPLPCREGSLLGHREW